MKKLFSLFLVVTLALSLSCVAYADNFTPSAEQKPAPEVAEDAIVIVGSDVTVDMAGFVVAAVDGTNSLDTSKLTEAEVEELAEITKELELAAETVAAAGKLREVIWSENFSSDKNYAVTDMFSVSAVGETRKQMEQVMAQSGTITLTFDLKADKDAELHIATMVDGKWTVLEPQNVVNLGDGRVAVTFAVMGPVAVVQPVEAVDGAVQAPQTSDTLPVYGIISVACVAAAIGCFVINSKKREA